jgi:hypothetical protein
LTCSGTTANIYGTVHFGAAVRDIHLVLSGTSTSPGTFSIQEAWAGGSYSKTISGGGIVSVTCPV